MSEPPAHDQAEFGAVRVNKAELASILKCSLPTLDKMLRQHGDAFPVIRRGTNGVEWQFDPAAVVAFLTELDQARIAAGQARDDLMRQYTLPGVSAEEETPGLTAGDRLKLAQLRKIEREEQISAGFLIETAKVRSIVSAVLINLRRDLTTGIRIPCRDANLPETVIRSIEARFADAQRNAVATLRKQLLTDPETLNHGDEPALL